MIGLTAVTKGPREVAGAITASTMTTVAVFLPLGFAGGFISQFFLTFSLTVTFALLASLIVALTVVPVLAYLLVDRVSGAVDETGEPTNSFWVRVYDPAIRYVLRSRSTRIGTVAVSAAPVHRVAEPRAQPPDCFHRLRVREDRPGERLAAVRSVVRPGPRARARSPRPSCSTIPTSSSWPRACPARTTSGSRPPSPPSSAGPRTARGSSSDSTPRSTSRPRSSRSSKSSTRSLPMATR